MLIKANYTYTALLAVNILIIFQIDPFLSPIFEIYFKKRSVFRSIITNKDYF